MPDERTTQYLIGEWGERTFPDASVMLYLDKLYIEMMELMDCMEMMDNPRSPHSEETLPGELADVAIVLYQIAHYTGVDLHQAIQEKHVINTQRTWVRLPDGTYRHKEVSDAD